MISLLPHQVFWQCVISDPIIVVHTFPQQPHAVMGVNEPCQYYQYY